MKMIWKLNFLGQLLLCVSLVQARDTKNLDLTKPDSASASTKHTTNYDTPENCKGENMEWLTSGPVCDVHCDYQPAGQTGGSHHRKQCQARMYDVIHDIINDAEEDSFKAFNNGILDLDRIAENVTHTMRNWGLARAHKQESTVYEGCYCKSGFARYGDNCVAIRDCPSRDYPAPNDCKAGNHEVWKDDGPGCDVYCPVQPNKSKYRSIYSNRNQIKCEGDVLQTLQEFEPSVQDLLTDTGKEALSKHGEVVTRKLRSGHVPNKEAGVLTQASGCYCIDGYLRYGDLCLKPENCPSTDGPIGNPNLCNGLNEEFHKVSEHCEVYCEIQPNKHTGINSCGRTGSFLRGYLSTLDEYKNSFDEASVVEKHAENITESLRSNNKQTFSDGCYCKAGHARYGYRCIRLDHCPMRKCHKWEVFQTEGPICEATCANLQYHHSVLIHGPNHYMPGCFCPAGQVRDDRGRCIDPTSCWNYHKQEQQEVIYHFDEDVVKEPVKEPVKEDLPGDRIPDTDHVRLETNHKEVTPPPILLTGEEKPIFNRKILETIPVKEEFPVVDGFKKETVPVVTVTKEEEKKPTIVKVPLSKEQVVVVVEEMSVPVVAIYDKA